MDELRWERVAEQVGGDCQGLEASQSGVHVSEQPPLTWDIKLRTTPPRELISSRAFLDSQLMFEGFHVCSKCRGRDLSAITLSQTLLDVIAPALSSGFNPTWQPSAPYEWRT